MRYCKEELKKLIDAFKDEEFGEPLAAPECAYTPKYLPPKAHPRLGFTQSKLERLREDINHPDNKYAKALVYSASDIDFDGIPTERESREIINNVRIKSGEFHFIILSKALRYALDGDEQYGYEALYAIKNMLAHCQDDWDVSFPVQYNISLTMAKLMQTTGYVYDWCYKLLSEQDKRQIVAAATGKASMGLEYNKFPPEAGGGICGHQAGPPYLQGWFPFTIAVYDEFPIYYNHIAELVYETIEPGQSYCVQGGAHPQGAAYGASRMHNMMFAECFFFNMFDEKKHLFSTKMEDATLDFLNCIRPDGQMIRIGDDYNQGTRYGAAVTNAMLGAYLYSNPYLKYFAKERLADFAIFHINEISPIEVILYNNVRLEPKKPVMPLVSYAGHPLGRYLIRTKKDGIDAGMVYMKIGEAYSTNHEHKDAGDFQIYYDGPLITSSGAYMGYGCKFDYAYYKQTISKNCPIIFNPNMQDNGKWIYSGGQKIATENNREPTTLDYWKSTDNFNRAKVLCHGSKVEGDEYKYSYLAGDITNAYDKETVADAKRYFFNFMTDNPAQPMIHIVFDRIESVEAEYKKTLLMHSVLKPYIEERAGKNFAIFSNIRRRLVVQSVLDDMEYTHVGSPDNPCPVNGETPPTPPPDYPEGVKVKFQAEMGIGRLELSPKEAKKLNLMMTVSYIDPDTDYSPYQAMNASLMNPLNVAVGFEGDNYVGALIMGYAVVFPRSGECFREDFNIVLPDSERIKECYVIGLGAEFDACGGDANIDGAIAVIKPQNKKIKFTKK